MKQVFTMLVAGLLVGCGPTDGDDISTSQKDNHETPNFGSATDIESADGSRKTSEALNAADNGIGGVPQREAGNYETQPLPGQSSDQELAKRIKVALTTGSMGTTGVVAENLLTKIDVQVQNGVVTLSGPVSSEQEKETIEKQVSGYKGVKEVVNKLTVGGRNLEGKPLEPLVPRTGGNQ